MKIIIFSNTSWSLYNFRFELIEYFSNKTQFNILLVCGDDDYKKKFKNLNITFLSFHLNRGFNSPISQTFSIVKLFGLLIKINPHVIFSFTVKPNIISGFYSFFPWFLLISMFG